MLSIELFFSPTWTELKLHYLWLVANMLKYEE